ncbi:MAG: TonB-dependent receptor [Gemmatimonadetes bacterium]|nr:TonB-dependent receptor [Gemmatimonadota bacterium]NNM07428.1 TonB-dependent receptor [Gemmatimonadota bacterium]
MTRHGFATWVFLSILLLCSTASPGVGQVGASDDPGQTTGTLRGTVSGRAGSQVKPLPDAILHVSSGSRHFTLTADSQGRYALPGLGPGPWRVRAIHVGYRTMAAAARVPVEGLVTLDLTLNREPVALPPILVATDRLRPVEPTRPPTPSEMAEVALRALEGTTGMAEGGLAQVVRSIPGNDPSDPQDVLLMRGSAADLKLVLLDGAPVYTPFHMAGLMESFEPQALGGASLFLGGAPARFDGGLSYILDLQGRTPRTDRIHGTASADLLSGRLLLEGPVGASAGFMLGTRGLHNIGTPLFGQGPSPYGFNDVLARLEWTGEEGKGAYVTGFWNRESVLLDLSDDAEAALSGEVDSGNTGILGEPPVGDDARWGNKAGAVGYRFRLGPATAQLRAAFNRYEAELPVGDSLPLFAQSRSDRTRFTADFSHPLGAGAIRFGASLDRVNSTYSAMSLDSARVGQVNRVELDGSSGGAYVEVTRPWTESLTIRGGGRLDRFEGHPGARVAPRLSIRWMLTDEAALTLAAGRYHQFSNLAAGEIEKNLGPGSPGPAYGESAPLELTVGTADHLVVALDQILTPDLRLGLEGFVKQFSGVAGTGDNSLNASGVDLRVARDGERTSGWLGYTLTWFWASDGFLSTGDSPFSGRHLLSAGLLTSITARTGLRLRASYGDGLPFTSVPVFGDGIGAPTQAERNTLDLAGDQVLNSAPNLTMGPDDGFLRLEVELFGRWTPTVSGRTMELRPYIRVLNALNRRDALFYHFDPWRAGGPVPLADLPLLPLVGVEWRF